MSSLANPNNGIAVPPTADASGTPSSKSIAVASVKNQSGLSSFFPPPRPLSSSTSPSQQQPSSQRLTVPLSFASQQFDTLLRTSETIVDNLRTKIDTARRRHSQMRDVLSQLAAQTTTTKTTVVSTTDNNKNAQRYLHTLPKHVNELILLLDESEEKIDCARSMLVEFLEQLDGEMASDDANTTSNSSTTSGSSRNSKDVSCDDDMMMSDDSAMQMCTSSSTPTNCSSLSNVCNTPPDCRQKQRPPSENASTPTTSASAVIRPLVPARVLYRPPLRSNVSVSGTMAKHMRHDLTVEKSLFDAVIAEHLPTRPASSDTQRSDTSQRARHSSLLGNNNGYHHSLSSSSLHQNINHQHHHHNGAPGAITPGGSGSGDGGAGALHRAPDVYDLVKELQLDETFAEFERQYKEMTTTSR